MELSRRNLLIGSTLVGGSFLFPKSFISSAYAVGKELSSPSVISSVNGVLNLNLVAAPKLVSYEGKTRWALTYNGSVPGPTLMVKPGDVLNINLVNKTGLMTNLHTHGLHVPPVANGDNPLIMISNGKSFKYQIKIPKNQRSGTFWYHPHHHEFVAKQLSAGLAGAIIVKDEIDKQKEFLSSTDRIMVLSDPRIGSDASVMDTSMMDQMHGRSGPYVLINGQLKPLITGKKDVAERWRFINACPSQYLELSVEGADISVISTDGGRVGKEISQPYVLMTPGQRYEILVRPKKSGMLRILNGTDVIGYFDAKSSNAFEFTPALLGSAPALKASKERKIIIKGSGMMNMGGEMGNHDMSFTFDGKVFDPKVVNQQVKLGVTEDWIIQNNSGMAHPFHIHAWDFQIIDRGDGKSVIGWKDTANIPSRSTVRLRIPFVDFGGTTVYHCHILDHEDAGMMGIVRVS